LEREYAGRGGLGGGMDNAAVAIWRADIVLLTAAPAEFGIF
jgi:hypothetical protein